MFGLPSELFECSPKNSEQHPNNDKGNTAAIQEQYGRMCEQSDMCARDAKPSISSGFLRAGFSLGNPEAVPNKVKGSPGSDPKKVSDFHGSLIAVKKFFIDRNQ